MAKSSFYSGTGITNNEQNAIDGAKNAAEAARDAAQVAQAAAETAETNAETAATSASGQATIATTKASEASTSSATATTKASEAAASAATATTKASEASASSAIATTKASEASSSAATSSTKAAEAAASAVTAASEASDAATSSGTATTKASEAAASAVTASGHASTATTKASEASSSAATASTQAANASSSAATASTQAANASSSASTATTKASEASSSASTASAAQIAAEGARDSALTAFESFDDRYLGVKSSDPTTDNDGDALAAGMLYFSSTDTAMKVYSGSAWVDAYVSGQDYMSLTGGTMTGDITFNSTQLFDGRDVSADGIKLDGIESNATADQTAAEIKTAYESNSDTNAFTDADHSKLNAIEASADVTDAANVNPLVDSHLNTSTASSGEYLSWTGSDYDWASVPAGYADSDVDTHLNTSGASTNQYLKWNGSDYAWSTVDLSNVDAVTVDGLDSTQFLRSDADDTYTGLLSFGSTGTRIDGSDGFPLVQVNSSRAYFGSTNRSTTTLASNSSTGLKANVSGTDYTVWHAGNDGSGSGLDADTLDSVHGSSFLRSDANDTSSGTIAFGTGTLDPDSYTGYSGGFGTIADGSGWSARGVFLHGGATGQAAALAISGNTTYFGSQNGTAANTMATILSVPHSTNVVNFSQTPTVGTDVIWHAGNDGPGSSLDADTVDGIEASSFLRSDADDTTSGVLTATDGIISEYLDLGTQGNRTLQALATRATIGSSGGYGDLYLQYFGGNLYTVNGGGTLYANGNTVWHDGNTATVIDQTTDITSQDWNTYIDGTEASWARVANMTGSNKPPNYTYGTALSISMSGSNKFQLYASHTGSDGNGLYFRTGWNTDYRGWAKIYDSVAHPALSYVDTATGSYGTIKVDDDRGVTWAGYAIRDDWVFMSNGAGNCGIYNDTDNEWAMYITQNGSVQLRYNGATTLETTSGGAAVTGALTATGDITAYYSDERLKNFEGKIDGALDKVSKLSGYYYHENDKAKELGFENDARQVGVSAQEVEAVMPEVVKPAPVDPEYKTVQYEKLVPLLIEAIKELKEEVRQLKEDKV